MYIRYGTRNRDLCDERMSVKCPNCGQTHDANVKVESTYFWFMTSFLSVFPFQKAASCYCAGCDYYLQFKVDDKLVEAMKLDKKKFRHSLVNYTVPIIILAIVLFSQVAKLFS
ncbi:hypothetical protein [Chitinophaga sp. Cy-1792]|uniref:hypothetical protein n=1 Tax=Chitinophaga sp. Cy-1792 TaxID=2608339 RepID=UPI001420B1B2|nr:hypothetical protein [Chitinophaga sp. Cy-1792]NIG55141.1 hypothetical protein [Chitinophaga sp. Cy-1792]